MIKVYALLAGWLLSIGGTAYLTHDYTMAKADQATVEAVQRAIEQQTAFDKETHDIELEAAREAQKTRIEYRTRVQKVIEYVEANPTRVQCFDNDGVRLYNENRTGVEDAASNPVREEPPGP